MPTRIMTDIQVVGAGASYDVQPPAGQEYKVSGIGSSAWVGVPPNAVPQVNVGIFDATLGPAFVLRAVDTRGWNKKQEFLISNANYLRLTNPGGGGANISFVAEQLRSFGTGPSVIVTDLQTVAAAATWDIQPAAGYEYLITEVGSSLWIGAAPAGLPDLTVSLFDGALAAIIQRGADVRGWNRNLKLYLNNTNYLRLTNTNAAQAVLAVVGKQARYYGAGATAVMTDIQTLGAGANWDVRPAAGEEWLVTDIGASIFLGVSPAALPQLTVSLFDGTNASILLQSTDLKGWMDEMEIKISNANYLRINDVGGAGIVAAISAVLTRQFS